MNNKGFTLLEIVFTLAIFSLVLSLALGMLVQSTKISAKYLSTNDALVLFDVAEKYFQSELTDAAGILLSESDDCPYESVDEKDPFSDSYTGSLAVMSISPNVRGRYDGNFSNFFGSDTKRHLSINMEVIDGYSILMDILIYDNNNELIYSKQKFIKCITSRQMGNEIQSRFEDDSKTIYRNPHIFYYLPDEGAGV